MHGEWVDPEEHIESCVKYQDYTSGSHLDSRIPKVCLKSRLYSLHIKLLCPMGPHHQSIWLIRPEKNLKAKASELIVLLEVNQIVSVGMLN